MTQAERDAAYNNIAAVPDSAALTAARIAGSAAYRAAHPGHLDLPYGPGERTKWDLFPAADPAAPCFVFIHGGYWQRGAREENAVVATGLAAHGWSVALPGYTLTPEASLAQIVGEISAALDWLQRENRAHGIAGPVLLSGWSAGGHLAAMALSHPLVRVGLAISGLFELGPIRDTYLNEKLRLTEDEIATLSPRRLAPVAKPMSVAYGGDELIALVNDSQAVHAHRRPVDAVGEDLNLPRLNHFTIIGELTRPDGALVQTALRLAPHMA